MPSARQHYRLGVKHAMKRIAGIEADEFDTDA